MVQVFYFGRKIFALLLILSLVTGSVAGTVTVFRCRYDGVARWTPGCVAPSPLYSTPGIARDCCCDREQIHLAPAPSELSKQDVLVQSFDLAVVVLLLDDLRRCPIPSDQVSLATGPPLLLKKQVLRV